MSRTHKIRAAHAYHHQAVDVLSDRKVKALAEVLAHKYPVAYRYGDNRQSNAMDKVRDRRIARAKAKREPLDLS